MKRRSWGLTLVEVLVASAIMLLITLSIVLVYRSMYAVQKKGEAQSDVYRKVMVSSARLRQELRGAKVEQPAPGGKSDRLQFRLPTIENDLMELDAMGRPVWGPQAEVRLDADGKLVLDEAGEPLRVLARLGQKSVLNIERQDNDLMVVTLTVEEEAASHQIPLTFYLGNQSP